MPRGGRTGLKIEDRLCAIRAKAKQSGLGVDREAEQSTRSSCGSPFNLNIQHYDGTAWPVLTLGGKTRQGALLRAIMQ